MSFGICFLDLKDDGLAVRVEYDVIRRCDFTNLVAADRKVVNLRLTLFVGYHIDGIFAGFDFMAVAARQPERNSGNRRCCSFNDLHDAERTLLQPADSGTGRDIADLRVFLHI